MRYAIISDIHSNIEALTACLDAIKTLDIDHIICLGDIVGYNANPNECVELLRGHKARALMGNHDALVAGLEGMDGFNLLAADAAVWTMKMITDENKAYLAGLAREIVVDGRFLAVHGWINDTDSYIMGANDALANFKLLKENYKTNLCFFGHTHVPVVYLDIDGAAGLAKVDEIRIKKDKNYLINPGSVGQPRDRDPRSSFAVYDTRKSTVTFHRQSYDINETGKKIVDAGLPARLAQRLKLGW